MNEWHETPAMVLASAEIESARAYLETAEWDSAPRLDAWLASAMQSDSPMRREP